MSLIDSQVILRKHIYLSENNIDRILIELESPVLPEELRTEKRFKMMEIRNKINSYVDAIEILQLEINKRVDRNDFTR